TDQDLSLGRLAVAVVPSDRLALELAPRELVAPVAEGALGKLHDIALVHQGDALALVRDGVIDRSTDEPLRALARDRLDPDARGVGETNLGDLHLLEQELDDLFRLGRFGFPFDAGIDVFSV